MSVCPRCGEPGQVLDTVETRAYKQEQYICEMCGKLWEHIEERPVVLVLVPRPKERDEIAELMYDMLPRHRPREALPPGEAVITGGGKSTGKSTRDKKIDLKKLTLSMLNQRLYIEI
jgi:uncharacterized protein YbaR (Trm112 family)